VIRACENIVELGRCFGGYCDPKGRMSRKPVLDPVTSDIDGDSSDVGGGHAQMSGKAHRNFDDQPLVTGGWRDTVAWRIFAGVVAALPFVGSAYVCWAAWMTPFRWGSGTTHYVVALMLAEFFAMHSSPFFTAVAASELTRAKKIVFTTVLGAIYLLMSGGYSLAVESTVPITTMAYLIASRFVSVAFGGHPGRRELKRQVVVWGISGTSYLLMATLTGAMTGLPRFGMTPDVVVSLHLPDRGLWFDEPHRVAAFGLFYFSTIAVTEVLYTPLQLLFRGRGREIGSQNNRRTLRTVGERGQ
jgi:hypothetical protein